MFFSFSNKTFRGSGEKPCITAYSKYTKTQLIFTAWYRAPNITYEQYEPIIPKYLCITLKSEAGKTKLTLLCSYSCISYKLVKSYKIHEPLGSRRMIETKAGCTMREFNLAGPRGEIGPAGPRGEISPARPSPPP
jgi:hypothetical protein